jgi:ABC-type glycerol-3-phosphate transport system permease component
VQPTQRASSLPDSPTCVGVVVLILAGYQFEWTGFKGKTLWDWFTFLEVVTIPVVVGVGAEKKGSAAHLTGMMNDWLPGFLLHRSTLLLQTLPHTLPRIAPGEE